MSRNDTRPPTSFARRIPDGKGSWGIFEKKEDNMLSLMAGNPNGSDGSGTRGTQKHFRLDSFFSGFHGIVESFSGTHGIFSTF